MFNKFKTLNTISSSFLILFLSSFILGQKMGTSPNENCNENKVIVFRLTTIRNEILEKNPEKDSNMPIIVIAHLGTKERFQRYNLQRLKEVKDYLKRTSPLNDELIMAQGEKVKGQGRVDFYFDGELQYRITLKHNQYLNLVKGGHCDAG